jgi:hypothetical protein
MKIPAKPSPLSKAEKARIIQELREKIQVAEAQFARGDYLGGGEGFSEMITQEIRRLVQEGVDEITPEIRDQIQQRLLARR